METKQRRAVEARAEENTKMLWVLEPLFPGDRLRSGSDHPGKKKTVGTP